MTVLAEDDVGVWLVMERISSNSKRKFEFTDVDINVHSGVARLPLSNEIDVNPSVECQVA